jgi:hypothetical protein
VGGGTSGQLWYCVRSNLKKFNLGFTTNQLNQLKMFLKAGFLAFLFVQPFPEKHEKIFQKLKKKKNTQTLTI